MVSSKDTETCKNLRQILNGIRDYDHQEKRDAIIVGGHQGFRNTISIKFYGEIY